MPDLMNSTDGLAHWQLRLLEFEFKIQHRLGRKNLVADSLFRLSSEIIDERDLNEDLSDKYDEYVGTILNVGRATDDRTPHPKKPTVSNLFKEQKTGPLCQELSKLVDNRNGH